VEVCAQMVQETENNDDEKSLTEENVATQGVPVESVLSSFPSLLEGVTRLGFTTLTAVQEQSLPLALSGHSLVIQARTGSGKTLAYALPALAHLKIGISTNRVQALLVTPTRELAVQVRDVLQQLEPRVKPVLVIGGTSIQVQEKQLASDQQVVVGTPGRILDMMRRKALVLDNCGFFALDEADEMLSLGFIEEVETILKALPGGIHGIFTSATITGRVGMLAKRYLNRHEAVVVETLAEDDYGAGDISHYVVKVPGDLLAKPKTALKVLEHFKPRSAIIFCNTKSDTEFVEAVLRKRDVKAQRINSDLSQSQRQKVMKDLRDGQFSVLIATDLAARGIDIDEIDVVINYSLHEQPETYVHRTGRTGRAGRSGAAVNLVGPRDIGTYFYLTKVLSHIEFQDLKL
jgi:ATP-dependent RNA helicase DeaD